MAIKSKSKKAKATKDEELKKRKKSKSKASSKTATKKPSKSKTSKTAKKTKSKTTTAKKGRRTKSSLIPIKEKFTQSTLLDHLATESGIEKKDVRKVIEALKETMMSSLVKRGLGEFTFPTMFKIVTKKKPATKEREGINPFTQEPTIFKAKPATTQVKMRPLVKLKKAAKNEI